jgi:hypothetical protein
VLLRKAKKSRNNQTNNIFFFTVVDSAVPSRPFALLFRIRAIAHLPPFSQKKLLMGISRLTFLGLFRFLHLVKYLPQQLLPKHNE